MKNLKICVYLLAMAAVMTASSCSTKNEQSDQEVKAMDSVATDLEATNKELDAQNAKVEASLEKIDKELNTSK